MSTTIQDIERRQLREVPRFKAGDTVRVHFKVIEGSRQRIQVFEGTVIKRVTCADLMSEVNGSGSFAAASATTTSRAPAASGPRISNTQSTKPMDVL